MENSEKTSAPPRSIRGRGAAENPANRFETLEIAKEEGGDAEGSLVTQYFKDHSKTAITYNDSPDVGFEASLNPYRGCEHGCIYCYARPTHEYLGFSAGLDFETKIMVKEDAPVLLRREFLSKRWRPQVLVMSGVTDCYQPIEKQLQLTRRCLEVCAEFRNPVAIITKNHLVTRDIDVLSELARLEAAAVFVSVTSLDKDLASKLEPRTSMPEHRLDAVRQLSQAGIPTGVMVAPVIPALNDMEIPAILKAAAQAGARTAGWVMVRLPYGVKHLFEEWLARHFPDRKEKVLHRLQSLRGGKLNDPTFGRRMRGEGPFAEQVSRLFDLGLKKAGLASKHFQLSTAAFRKPEGPQLALFS